MTQAKLRKELPQLKQKPDLTRLTPEARYYGLFQPLKFAAAQGAGLYHSAIQTAAKGGPKRIDRFIHIGRESDRNPVRLGIFAGLRGTDRHSPEAVTNFLLDLESDEVASTGTHLYAYPVTNHHGYVTESSGLSNGRDLYLDIWQESDDAVPYLIERELSVVQFHGIIVLLGVKNLSGISVQIHGAGATLFDSVIQPAVKAATRYAPPAESGDWAASQHLSLTSGGELRPRPFEVVIKVPLELSPLDQIEAWRTALHGILLSYRAYISEAQNI
jgi:hypothetical protein